MYEFEELPKHEWLQEACSFLVHETMHMRDVENVEAASLFLSKVPHEVGPRPHACLSLQGKNKQPNSLGCRRQHKYLSAQRGSAWHPWKPPAAEGWRKSPSEYDVPPQDPHSPFKSWIRKTKKWTERTSPNTMAYAQPTSSSPSGPAKKTGT